MHKKLLNIIILCFLLVSTVNAERFVEFEAFQSIIGSTGTLPTTNEITDYNAMVYVCEGVHGNDDTPQSIAPENYCDTYSSTLVDLSSGDQIDTLFSTDTNAITLSFPTLLQSQFGYGAIFFKEGYVPWEQAADANGPMDYSGAGASDSLQNPFSHPDPIYLGKVPVCEAQVDNLVVIKEDDPAGTITITVPAKLSNDIVSPLNEKGPIGFVPVELESHFGLETYVETNVLRLVTGPDGEITEELWATFPESRDDTIIVPYSGIVNLEHTWEPEVEGEYIVRSTANILDQKCENVLPGDTLKNFDVHITEDNLCESVLNGLIVEPNTPSLGDNIRVSFSHISKAEDNGQRTILSTDLYLTVFKPVETDQGETEFVIIYEDTLLAQEVQGQDPEIVAFDPFPLNDIEDVGDIIIQVQGAPNSCPIDGADISDQILEHPTRLTLPSRECNDGVDNLDTEDTLIDLEDPGCSSLLDTNEENGVLELQRILAQPKSRPFSVFDPSRTDARLTINGGDSLAHSVELINHFEEDLDVTVDIQIYDVDPTSSGATPTVLLSQTLPSQVVETTQRASFPLFFDRIDLDPGQYAVEIEAKTSKHSSLDDSFVYVLVVEGHECNDGINNDEDELIDQDDPGCHDDDPTTEENGNIEIVQVDLVNRDTIDSTTTVVNIPSQGVVPFISGTNLNHIIEVKNNYDRELLTKTIIQLDPDNHEGGQRFTNAFEELILPDGTVLYHINQENLDLIEDTYTVRIVSHADPIAAFSDIFTYTLDVTNLDGQFECNDGIDNDNDGFTDHGEDPACQRRTDNTERGAIKITQLLIDDEPIDPDEELFPGVYALKITYESDDYFKDTSLDLFLNTQKLLEDVPIPFVEPGEDHIIVSLIISEDNTLTFPNLITSFSNPQGLIATKVQPISIVPQCRDGLDNDDDGDFDTDDLGCLNENDPNEADAIALTITVECGNKIIQGEQLLCEVSAQDDHSFVGGVDVTLRYDDGSEFGSCTTASNGRCTIQADAPSNADIYHLFITAMRQGYQPNPTLPITFEVVDGRYTIDTIQVFSDAEFSHESYDFFRGEVAYVTFEVIDLLTDEVSSVNPQEVLFSSERGGTTTLERVRVEDNLHYYKINPIPLSREFGGSAQEFTFKFDSLTRTFPGRLIIRNNVPTTNEIEEHTVELGQTIEIALPEHSDLESSDVNIGRKIEFVDPALAIGEIITNDQGERVIAITGRSTLNAPRASTTAIFSIIDEDGETAQSEFIINVVRPALCQSDAQCGTDGFVDNTFACSEEGNVLQNYVEHTCLNPGTPEANCISDVGAQEVQSCEHGCSDGQCQTITCSSDAQCGTSGFVPNTEICSVSGNVLQDYTAHTCVNPATTQSTCEESTTSRVKATCEDGCSDGRCLNIACFSNSECGSDGFINPNSAQCSANGVTQDYIQHTCSNAGSESSFCSNSVTTRLRESCQHGCSNGACLVGTIECFSDAQCGTNGPVGFAFCQDGHKAQRFIAHTCSNPGTFNSDCDSTVSSPIIVETCEFGCSNGACVDASQISCFSNADCPSITFSGQPFCESGNVRQGYAQYRCDQPGTLNAQCVVSQTGHAIVHSCENGCFNGACQDRSEPSIRSSDLFVTNIRFGRADGFSLDDRIYLSTSLENQGSVDLDNVKVSATIYDLGLYYSFGSFDLSSGERETISQGRSLPYSLVPGWYDIRIVISNDDVRRVIHRELYVE